VPETWFLRQFWQQYGDLVKKPGFSDPYAIAPCATVPETGFMRKFWQPYGDLGKKPLGPLGDRPLCQSARNRVYAPILATIRRFSKENKIHNRLFPKV
jgi:hypothetical protein